MNFNSAIRDVTSGLNLRPEDVLKIAYDEIESAISSFREEIRLAQNVETLEFLRRNIWDKLFATNGCYYDLCKRSPMLKILRLNADIRYCDLLKKKKKNEQEEIIFNVIKTSRPHTRSQTIRQLEECHAVEVDGELMENEIIY